MKNINHCEQKEINSIEKITVHKFIRTNMHHFFPHQAKPPADISQYRTSHQGTPELKSILVFSITSVIQFSEKRNDIYSFLHNHLSFKYMSEK